MLSRAWAVLASTVVVLTLVSACGDDPAGLDEIAPEELIGTYAASTFTARFGSTTNNLLAFGASIELTLLEDGTTTGRLFVPAVVAGGADFDQNLAGTFSFNDTNNEVTFDQPANTFVRDVTFIARRSGSIVQLEAEDTSQGTTVRVVLRPAT